MALEWRHAAHVAADPDAVYGWLTDYTEDDHASDAFRAAADAKGKPAKRAIVSRNAREVVLEDQWGGKRARTTARLEPASRTVRVTGDFGGYESVWRAVPERGGTRVEMEGRMAPTGLFKLLMPLFAKSALSETEKDFRGHIAALEADLKVRPR